MMLRNESLEEPVSSASSSLISSDEGSLDDGEVDPRVQEELNRLNVASEEINRLETQLDDARSRFRELLTVSTEDLKNLAKKLGQSNIDKARPYYIALVQSEEAQKQTQIAAVRFERACSNLTAAKETIGLAEEGFMRKGQPLDSAWQEMLNHATTKVNAAELEKAESAEEHERTAAQFNAAQRRLHALQADLKRTIAKSRPYFEAKAKYNEQLDAQKLLVSKFEHQVSMLKAIYAGALRTLEQISEQIHGQRSEAREKRAEARRQRAVRRNMGARSEGVGAESPTPPPPRRDKRLSGDKLSADFVSVEKEAAAPVVPQCHSEQVPLAAPTIASKKKSTHASSSSAAQHMRRRRAARRRRSEELLLLRPITSAQQAEMQPNRNACRDANDYPASIQHPMYRPDSPLLSRRSMSPLANKSGIVHPGHYRAQPITAPVDGAGLPFSDQSRPYPLPTPDLPPNVKPYPVRTPAPNLVNSESNEATPESTTLNAPSADAPRVSPSKSSYSFKDVSLDDTDDETTSKHNDGTSNLTEVTLKNEEVVYDGDDNETESDIEATTEGIIAQNLPLPSSSPRNSNDNNSLTPSDVLRAEEMESEALEEIGRLPSFTPPDSPRTASPFAQSCDDRMLRRLRPNAIVLEGHSEPLTEAEQEQMKSAIDRRLSLQLSAAPPEMLHITLPSTRSAAPDDLGALSAPPVQMPVFGASRTMRRQISADAENNKAAPLSAGGDRRSLGGDVGDRETRRRETERITQLLRRMRLPSGESSGRKSSARRRNRSSSSTTETPTDTKTFAAPPLPPIDSPTLADKAELIEEEI